MELERLMCGVDEWKVAPDAIGPHGFLLSSAEECTLAAVARKSFL